MQTEARRIALSHFPRSLTKIVSIEYDVSIRFKGRWHRRSFAASVPSHSFSQEKIQKRISKEERRAMVVDFVDRYRASNAGRFPTISLAQQEIGGSFYTVRHIIQELAYNHKMSPLKKIEEAQSGKGEKVIYPSSDVIEEPSSSIAGKNLNSVAETCSSHRQSVDLGTRSETNVVSSANLDESSLIGNGEATGLFEAKQLSTSDGRKNVGEEPKSHSTEAIEHSGKQIMEGESDQMVGDPQIDVVIVEKDIQNLNSSTTKSYNSDKQSVGYGRIENGEAVELFKGRESVISADAGTIFSEVPNSHLNETIDLPGNQTVEGVSSQMVSDAQIDGGIVEKDRLTKISTKKGKVAQCSSQADSSVSMDLETSIDISQSPPLHIQDRGGDIRSSQSLQDHPIGAKGGEEQKSNDECSSIPQKDASDKPRGVEEDSSSPKRLTIWGNLKSLADEIIGFWKRM